MKVVSSIAGVMAGCAVAVGCQTGPSEQRVGVGAISAFSGTSELARFSRCEGLADHMRTHLAQRVGPYGLDGVGFRNRFSFPGAVEATTDAASGDSARADFSTTNNQESDVDEADAVKTDGTTMFAVAGTKLRAIDVSEGGAELIDTLSLGNEGYGSKILLSGDRLLVIGYGSGRDLEPAAADGPADAAFGRHALPAATTLTLVDVADPSNLRVLETLTAEGEWIAARLADGHVRLVLSSRPSGPAFVSPRLNARNGTDQVALRVATARNRAILANSTAADWLPRMAVSRADGTSENGLLVDCDTVSRPADFSGTATLSVLTIDPSESVTPVDRDAVMTDGRLVYASTDSLYVATPRWFDPTRGPAEFAAEDVTTQIHRFETRGSDTDYRSTGRVPGHLLSQFAMSEHDGVLRVASTTEPQWSGGDIAQQSESYVTTLREEAGVLQEIGQVGGLGKGERIFSVRFIGEMGYVVTFRQVDPLYTVDLSDPELPRVTGELKITGYSAYLHPVGEGLLLGVGQEATPEGRLTGAQVSLFDISDPARPARLAKRLLGKSSTGVEWDHHAFLHWPATGLTVLPLTTHTGGPNGWQAKAVGLRVSPDGISSVGEVTHPTRENYPDPISRSAVIGESLYTLSERGLAASDLGTLERKVFLPL